ncbi:MAG: pyridoxamine 5'-phosphate oxidase family protein [Oscillospiraceae bacterium]|nr:pyridoxamine 5'-phosphate oxidase family protein [Oscillospiraceae bacterium]
MNQDTITKVAELIKENSAQGQAGFGFCTLSLIDEEGFPTASVMMPSKSEGINQITFGTMLDENRAKRAAKDNKASVCFATAAYCINLVGEVEVITADEVKRDMWYDGLVHHFTGPDDPNYCVLKFNTKRYKFFIDGEDVAGTV